jgi:hypothetical protein
VPISPHLSPLILHVETAGRWSQPEAPTFAPTQVWGPGGPRRIFSYSVRSIAVESARAKLDLEHEVGGKVFNFCSKARSVDMHLFAVIAGLDPAIPMIRHGRAPLNAMAGPSRAMTIQSFAGRAS